MSVKEILNKAADVIEERGLYKGRWFVDPQGQCVCTVGGIQLAAGGEVSAIEDDTIRYAILGYGDEAWEAEEFFCSFLTSVKGVGVRSVPVWSDEMATQERVIRYLREAAETAP